MAWSPDIIKKNEIRISPDFRSFFIARNSTIFIKVKTEKDNKIFDIFCLFYKNF